MRAHRTPPTGAPVNAMITPDAMPLEVFIPLALVLWTLMLAPILRRGGRR